MPLSRSTQKGFTNLLEAAVQIHENVGPNQNWGAYESALAFEFAWRELIFQRQNVHFLKNRDGELCPDRMIVLDFVLEGAIGILIRENMTRDRHLETLLQSYLKIAETRLIVALDFTVPDLCNGVRFAPEHRKLTRLLRTL